MNVDIKIEGQKASETSPTIFSKLLFKQLLSALLNGNDYLKEMTSGALKKKSLIPNLVDVEKPNKSLELPSGVFG